MHANFKQNSKTSTMNMFSVYTIRKNCLQNGEIFKLPLIFVIPNIK